MLGNSQLSKAITRAECVPDCQERALNNVCSTALKVKNNCDAGSRRWYLKYIIYWAWRKVSRNPLLHKSDNHVKYCISQMLIWRNYLNHNKSQESQSIQPNLIDSGICNTTSAIWNIPSGFQKIVSIKSKQAGRLKHLQINKPITNKKSGGGGEEWLVGRVRTFWNSNQPRSSTLFRRGGSSDYILISCRAIFFLVLKQQDFKVRQIIWKKTICKNRLCDVK